MDHDDWDVPDGTDTSPEIEDLPAPTGVERTGPRPMARPRRTGARHRAGVAAALVATLVVGTVAFGAELGLVGTRTDGDGATASPADLVEADPTEKPEPTQQPKATETADGTEPPKPTEATAPTTAPEPTDKPTPEPTTKPAPKPTPKPEPKATPKPEPKPTPKPEVKTLDIAVVIKEGVVVVKWSVCGIDGADAYKVVRSKDSSVRWPTGQDDELIAAVGMDGALKVWDEHAPAGKQRFYRVFCVKHTDAGYQVLAKSGVESIVVPEATLKPTPTPTPEVSSLWLEAGADQGEIVLHWEACDSDGFSHYRIVRKVDGEGSVIAEIEEAGTTSYRDGTVEPGATYHYLVQAKGTVDGEWVLLGTTDWVAVSIE